MTPNRTARGCILGLVLFLLAQMSLSAADLKFAREEELGNIVAFIAKLGNFNVIVDPTIAKNRMRIELNNVEPLEALNLVAKIRNYRVLKVPEITGKDTYAIGNPDTIMNGFEVGTSETKRLRYAKAEDVAGILAKGLGKDAKVNVEKDPRTNSLILQATSDVLKKVDTLVSELDLPVPQVVIDAKIVQVITNRTKDLGFVWNYGVGKTADGTTQGQQGSGPILALTEYQKIQPNGNFYDSPGTASGGNLFTFGDFFRGNLFFNASLNALESDSVTRTLASPRLLAINGATAQLRIGDKIVFAPSPTQPPEERDTGMTMNITPRINRDNFITMDVDVSQSVPDFGRGPDRPTISQTNAKTTVQVHDGEEILLGGLVQEKDTVSNAKVAFLGDLPLLKYFFKHSINNPITTEIVILLTPRVVKSAVAPGETPVEGPGPEASASAKPPDDLNLDNDLGPGPSASPGGPPSPRPSASASPDDDLGL